jgi:transposase
MHMPYSNDLRQRVMQFIEAGGCKKQAAQIFGVCLKTIWNWIKRKREGNLAPKVRVTPSRKIDSQLLLEFISCHPDAYLREIADHFGVTIQAIFYACKRHKISLKKRVSSIKKGMTSKELNFKRK